MAGRTISAPVGDRKWLERSKYRTYNNKSDIKTVQELLIQASTFWPKEIKYKYKKASGVISKKSSATVQAIRAFQKIFLKNPDGVVEPGKKTLRNLNLVTLVTTGDAKTEAFAKSVLRQYKRSCIFWHGAHVYTPARFRRIATLITQGKVDVDVWPKDLAKAIVGEATGFRVTDGGRSEIVLTEPAKRQGRLIIHECTHAIQKHVIKKDTMRVLEAEVAALTAEWLYQLESKGDRAAKKDAEKHVIDLRAYNLAKEYRKRGGATPWRGVASRGANLFSSLPGKELKKLEDAIKGTYKNWSQTQQ